MGFGFTDLRGLQKVNGEFALILTVYNLKRTISLLGIEDLTEKLKNWKPDYKKTYLPSKSKLIEPIMKFLDYFGVNTSTVKLTPDLNRVQFSDPINRLYRSEMDFSGESNGFFTV